MKPRQSYRIWFTQRNGSTLLCKGLEQTGIAGIPGEYFNVMDANSLCEKYDVASYEALRQRLWDLGTTANGVFGIKHSLHSTMHGKVFAEIKALKGIAEQNEIGEETLLSDLFPNCKHLFLTRRNKVRQAVSWWKAIKDNVWHLESKAEHRNEADFYEKNYDFAALSHLFKEAALRECAIQAYFSKYNIQPLTFVYEDFVEDFDYTIQKIIDYLEIDYSELNLGKMFYRKTANAHSEQWVQRFRQELNASMGSQIW